MPKVLTTAGKLMCGHDPSDITLTSMAKLGVGGQKVVVKTDVLAGTIAQCATQNTVDSNGVTNNLKCTKVSAVATGEATKLTVGGVKVMLETLTGSTLGMVLYMTPQTLLRATAVQAKLTAL